MCVLGLVCVQHQHGNIPNTQKAVFLSLSPSLPLYNLCRSLSISEDLRAQKTMEESQELALTQLRTSVEKLSSSTEVIKVVGVLLAILIHIRKSDCFCYVFFHL